MDLRWVLLAALGLAAPAAMAVDAARLGEDLYLGRASLQGYLRGDDSILPSEAVVCAHCHEPSARPGGALQALAPRLDARLQDALPRRGGPASRYDEAALCRLLRTGFDPASVLVRRTMPRFDASAEQCATLWAFLSPRPALKEAP